MTTAQRRMVAITSIALLPLLFVVMATWSGDGGVEVTTDGDEEAERDAAETRPDPGAPSRAIGLLGPTDGVASRLLPVTVEPSTRLADGQVVRISGSGFTPRATLGAVLCSAGAGGGGGVAFCELAHYDNFQASAEGSFVDDYVLRRFIETPAEGRVDCLEATDRCLLAVGNTSDYDESGGSFITFEGAADPPPPQLTVFPSEGLVDGQVVSIKATGVRAAPDAWLRQCPAGQVALESCTALVAQLDGPAIGGQLSVTVQLSRTLPVGDGQVDCAVAPGCVITTTEYAGRSAVVPIGFAATSEPPATTPPPTSTAPPTTTPPPLADATTVPAPTTTLPAQPSATTLPEPTTTVTPQPATTAPSTTSTLLTPSPTTDD